MPTHNQDADRNIQLPKVAVIIPCYNHADYVTEAIMSVVEQDYPLKAIFLSDEKSTDDSWNTVLSLMEDKVVQNDFVIGKIKNTSILASQNPNPNGPSDARNRLIKMAWESSDWFCMLDADDYYLPKKISKSVEVMLEQPQMIGLVYTDAIIYHQNTGLKIREYREPFSRVRLEQECIVSNTPLVNKRVLEQVGLYDGSMRTAEDWDLWLRITQQNVAVHIPEALHVYRVTGKNASNVVPKEIWNENWQKIRDRINGQRN
jgi:glycosyltransferase involved in cell wall biosynthesis